MEEITTKKIDNNLDKDIKKDNTKKIVLWEGFKKELPWVIFWILILLMTYGYYQDKKICEEVLSDPCSACYKLNITSEPSGIIINQSLFDTEDKNPNTKKTILNYEEQLKKEQED